MYEISYYLWYYVGLATNLLCMKLVIIYDIM